MIARLGRFLRLPPPDRRLLVTAALLQAAIRLGLTLLPYRKLRGLVDGLALGRPRRRLAPAASRERVARAVTRASHVVPGATCLTQALAAKVLLEREGHSARVRVGVNRAADERLLAHAWVESEGHIVLGGSDLQRYTPLALVDPVSPGGETASVKGNQS